MHAVLSEPTTLPLPLQMFQLLDHPAKIFQIFILISPPFCHSHLGFSPLGQRQRCCPRTLLLSSSSTGLPKAPLQGSGLRFEPMFAYIKCHGASVSQAFQRVPMNLRKLLPGSNCWWPHCVWTLPLHTLSKQMTFLWVWVLGSALHTWSTACIQGVIFNLREPHRHASWCHFGHHSFLL